MKIKRTLPPAGAPLYLADFAKGIRGMAWPSRALITLENSIKEYFGVRHVFLVSSGKAALTVILQALADVSNRRDVIIPSYTCFSVPAAIAKAGLRVVICDIERNSIDYNINQLRERINKNTLGIIASHLFGIPCDLPLLVSVARSNESFLIEDCAQAMGAESNERKLGTFGDIGFFSFGRGKNICAVSGGIIVTNTDFLATALARRISRLANERMRTSVVSLLAASFVFLFSRPFIYWFPASLPFLGLGKTVYSPDFRLEPLSGALAGLASNWRSKLCAFNRVRTAFAATYKRELASCGFDFIGEPDGASCVYPRFPIIVSPQDRERIYQTLLQAGLGVSGNYPSSVAEIPELELSESEKEKCPNGKALARSLITLPTHPDVSPRDVSRIIELLKQAVLFRLKDTGAFESSCEDGITYAEN